MITRANFIMAAFLCHLTRHRMIFVLGLRVRSNNFVVKPSNLSRRYYQDTTSSNLLHNVQQFSQNL